MAASTVSAYATPMTQGCQIQLDTAQNPQMRYLYASCLDGNGNPYIQLFTINGLQRETMIYPKPPQPHQ